MASPQRQRVDQLNPATVRELEDIAGPRLDRALKGPYEIGMEPWPLQARGVYMVFDIWDKCVYVGKVGSSIDLVRLGSRFNEHLRDPIKRSKWHHFYVLPMKRSASNAHIEKVEGWVARRLRPSDTQRSPNPRRPHRRVRRTR